MVAMVALTIYMIQMKYVVKGHAQLCDYFEPHLFVTNVASTKHIRKWPKQLVIS